MTEPNPAMPLGAWLAGLPDEQLIRLLQLRPDLTQPPPGSIAALAARAQSRQSVKAATDDLDYLRLSVLDGLLLLHADASAVPVAKLLSLFGDDERVTAAVDDLRNRALVWGDTSLRVTAEAASGLPWYPGQVTAETAAPDPAAIAERLTGLDTPARELLERLVEGSPSGGRGTLRRERRPTAPCSVCWPLGCCGNSTTTP